MNKIKELLAKLIAKVKALFAPKPAPVVKENEVGDYHYQITFVTEEDSLKEELEELSCLPDPEDNSETVTFVLPEDLAPTFQKKPKKNNKKKPAKKKKPSKKKK